MTDRRTSPSGPSLFASLQAGRALAAILVAFYHASAYIFSLDKYWGFDPARHFMDFGRAGVEFFFVLSGFIIFYIHAKDINRPDRVFPYAAKRFLRIYPIYWLIVGVVMAIYFAVPSFGLPYQREPGTILSSLLLVHVDGTSDTELAAAWTLYHEILFYAVFSLLILRKELGVAVLSLWMALSAATLFVTPSVYIVEFFFSPLHLLFGMGMIACWTVSHGPIRRPGLVALGGIALFLSAGADEDFFSLVSAMPRNLIYGVASALAVVGAVELERQDRLKVPGWLVLSGNASYVIYLINFTVLSFLAKILVFAGAREMLNPLAAYVIVTALSVVSGVILHLWIEKPLMKTTRAWFRKAAMGPSPSLG